MKGKTNMAQFNLNDYETVEERLRRAKADHEDMRIVTTNLTQPSDRVSNTWVVRAEVFFTMADQAVGCPNGTGLAFEIDGVGMANKTSALENAETSAIGRALANAGYSGNKRATREEMAKVKRGPAPARDIDWAARIAILSSKKHARELYAEAQQKNASQDVLDLIQEKAASLPE